MAECTCCAEHADRMRRTEERIAETHALILSLAEKIGPALTMVGKPGGIASLLFSRTK